jgi:hypothetical protein
VCESGEVTMEKSTSQENLSGRRETRLFLGGGDLVLKPQLV